MIPIIPILAWTGGIAAGAQVAGGVVRGVGELVRGHPGAALVEVADGLVAPLRNACEQVAKLGGDIYGTVMGGAHTCILQLPAPAVVAPGSRKRRRKQQAQALAAVASPNGVPGVVAAD